MFQFDFHRPARTSMILARRCLFDNFSPIQEVFHGHNFLAQVDPRVTRFLKSHARCSSMANG